MRKTFFTVVLALALCLTCFNPAAAHGYGLPLPLPDAWVSIQAGGNFPLNTDVDFMAPPFKGTLKNAGFDSGPLFGLAAGLDFDGPAPLNVLGLMLDLSYNTMDFAGGRFSGPIWPSSYTSLSLPKLSGNQWTLAILLKARLPLSQRFQPYVAAGPGVCWTTMDFGAIGGPSQTSTDLALIAEGGVRAFLDQKSKWSLDLGVRYKHVSPEFSFRRSINYVEAKGDADSLGVILRLAYHFR